MPNTIKTEKMIDLADLSLTMKNHTLSLLTTSKMICQETNPKTTGPQTKAASSTQSQPMPPEESQIKSTHRLPKSTTIRMKSMPATYVTRNQLLNK